MNAYPLNLILTAATAAATIFLGFLPTKNTPSPFFARETFKAALAWLLVALISPPTILHFYILFSLLCFGAWWKFRDDHAFSGKIFLTLASGLGISLGVILLLAVTPDSLPAHYFETIDTLNDPAVQMSGRLDQLSLLVSIYLGGAVIGLAYVCFTLVQSTKTNSGITQGMIQRYVGLLLFLVIARAASMLGSCFFSLDFGMEPPPLHLDLEYLLWCLAVLIMPIVALSAQRVTRFSSRVQPTRLLSAIIFLGLLTEILARHFAL